MGMSQSTSKRWRVSRIMRDGTTSCTDYVKEEYARNDFYGRDGWPHVPSDAAMLYEYVAGRWVRKAMIA